MDSPAQMMLAEFCERAGLTPPELIPQAYIGIVIDDRLVSVDLIGSTKLKLLTILDLPSGREIEVLRKAAAHNEKMGEIAGPIVGVNDDAVVAVHEEIDVQGMHFQEFEQRLSNFNAICDAITNLPPNDDSLDNIPNYAIYG